MRSILSPLPPTSRIERRPKSKGKAKLAHAKYGFSDKASSKGRKPAMKFQKKLVVIDYMGLSAPRSFGLKESYILLRGMLPEISVSASEREVRSFIRDALKDSDDTLLGCSPDDFEYLEANGKNLSTPAHQSDFEWTGRAVKQLAGNGAVYVRLTNEREQDVGDFSDSSTDSPDVKIIKVERACEC